MNEESWKEELQSIADDNGGLLRPQMVVEYASNPKTALHSHFEWDDTEAATRYRIHQARQLIRVVVAYTTKEQTAPTRAWVSVSTDRHEDGGYRRVAEVVKNVDLRLQLLEDAKKEMIGFKVKYKQLNELASVFAAIDDVLHEDIPSLPLGKSMQQVAAA